MGEKKRIFYWDNLKGILILLVVFGHYVENGMWNASAWTAVYCFHMPAFIFVNGYFLGRSNRNPIDRIPRILGLYVLMEMLYMVLALQQGKGLSFTFGSPEYGCWYLLFLVYGYVTAYFIRGKKPGLVLAAALLISLLAGFDQTLADRFRVGQSMYYMPYLIAGFFLDVDDITEWARRHRWLCACCFVLIQACLFLARGYYDRKIFRGLEIYSKLSLSPGVGMLERCGTYLISGLLVLCLLGLTPKGKCLLSVIGRHTLVIYLVHTFLLRNFYAQICQTLGGNNLLALAVMTVLIPAVCIVLIMGQKLLRRRL